MSVSASDLKIYGAAFIDDFGFSSQGGAIDTSVAYTFNTGLVNSINDTITIVGVATDTRNFTITGRTIAGSLITESLTLSGTTPIVTANSYSRILKIDFSGTRAGITEVYKTTGLVSLASIPALVTSIRSLFYNIPDEVNNGSTKTYYEKIFVRNNSADDLMDATFYDAGGDTGNYITFALDDVVNGNYSVANRETTPSAASIGATGFTSLSKTLAAETDAGTADLTSTSRIGIWVKMTLPNGSAPVADTWSLGIRGGTF